MTSRFAVKMVLAAIAAGCVVSYRRSHQRRVHARTRAKPESLQRWEGEGGAVPGSGSRVAVQADEHRSLSGIPGVGGDVTLL